MTATSPSRPGFSARTPPIPRLTRTSRPSLGSSSRRTGRRRGRRPSTTAQTQTTTTTTPAGSEKPSTVYRGALLATVNAGATLTLTTSAGKPVVSLKSGRYTFKVTDGSTRLGFGLTEIGKQAKSLTGAAFVGKRSVTVELAPGQWYFSPNAFHQRSYFDVVG